MSKRGGLARPIGWAGATLTVAALTLRRAAWAISSRSPAMRRSGRYQSTRLSTLVSMHGPGMSMHGLATSALRTRWRDRTSALRTRRRDRTGSLRTRRRDRTSALRTGRRDRTGSLRSRRRGRTCTTSQTRTAAGRPCPILEEEAHMQVLKCKSSNKSPRRASSGRELVLCCATSLTAQGHPTGHKSDRV